VPTSGRIASRQISPLVLGEAGRREHGTLSTLQETWDDRFAAALAGYLQGVKLEQGIIVVTPPLGPEGRIFEGDPANRSDNLIAVRAAHRAPELVEEYRRSFPTLAPPEAGPQEVAAEFVRAFLLDEGVEAAMREALRGM
jgi:hypothetical protein